ncbi:MAG: ATPase, T2SS/T4P/T4SS family, partial [Candidatus Omnitrophica bacterium]|nr:ATPase, T2SS/T4P/T4SS family [Candidatus Omnitrophota bacterium]
MATNRGKRLLGEELVRAGIITQEQLEFALKEQQKAGEKKELLGEIIVRAGLADEATLIKFLEKHFDIPYAHLGRREDVNLAAVKLIPEIMARNFRAIAIDINNTTNKLVVAMANPFDIVAVDTIRAATGYEIDKRFSQAKDIENAIDRSYPEHAMQKSMEEFAEFKAAEEKEAGIAVAPGMQREDVESDAFKTPVVQFVDSMLKDAIQKRASDIHVEPREGALSIRYRVDGILVEMPTPPKKMQSAIITRLKLLCGMNIAEQRLPQDGRFNLDLKGKAIDIRVASSPIVHGEKMVLRILDSTSLFVKMEDLGMAEDNVKEFKSILRQSYGLVLVTGPTGSGKTTTLYSALSFINTPDKNIVTIEDPVEYQLQGINQIQTKHQIGLTFSAGLRTVLRQDPDIIMIGEIRDLETLENAIKASLTGHLVLSTIHTNDAPSVVTRLVHMGLEPYLIAPTLSLVIAQRLARKICRSCRTEIQVPSEVVEQFGKRNDIDLKHITFFRGKGCARCDFTGYKGRTGLFEFFCITKRIRDLILEMAPEDKMKKAAQEEGMKTIFQHGLEKVNQGITTIEEVLRVTVLEKA